MPRSTLRPPLPSRLLADKLEDVDRLMRRQRWEKASEMLNDLDRRFPNQPEIIGRLLDLCYQTKDMMGYMLACERLVKLEPDDADLTLSLAGAYTSNGFSGLALRTFQRFLENWPEHPSAAEARQATDELKKGLEQEFAQLGVSREEALQLAAQNDEMQAFLQRGQYRQAISLGEMLIQRWPQFIPAYNNLGQAYWVEGQPDKAIAAGQKALELAPDDLHALANLARYACLTGKTGEARDYAQRMRASGAPAFTRSLKIAETLAYLGDDEGILETVKQEGQDDHPLLYHLAGAASLRLDRQEEAVGYWKKSLELSPDFALAKGNLEDLKKPVAERQTPWYYNLPYWVPNHLMSEFLRLIEPQNRRQDEAAMQRAARRYVERHPEMVALVPLMLDRGDEMAREFGLGLVRMAETPELLQAARDFALSRRGSDQMRMEAAQLATYHGLIPSGLTRLWIEGQWSDILMMGFDVTTETPKKHKPEVENWIHQALEASRKGDPKQAEELLMQALSAEPEAPDILNNLAAAYDAQGRREEAIAQIEQIHERFPDYFFGRTGLANVCIQRGELERADLLLEPLRLFKRMHASEFDAFCAVHIELYLAQENRNAARTWFMLWESNDKQNPKLERYRGRVK